MSYLPQARLSRPARASCELWRLAVGLVAMLVLQTLLVQGVVALMRAGLPFERYAALLTAAERADTPAGMLLQLFFAGLLGVAALVVVRHLHGRDGAGLFGPRPQAVAQFGAVLWSLLRLYALVLAVWMVLPLPAGPQDGGTEMVPGLPFRQWLALLPLTLVALLFQTGAEEVAFRGYVQSQLAARVARPAVWMALPSAIFAALHYAPGLFGAAAWVVVVWAFAFGLAAADLTARSGTLGPAIALHFVNNLMAVAIQGHVAFGAGLALYVVETDLSDPAPFVAQLPVDLALLGLFWLAARIAIRA